MISPKWTTHSIKEVEIWPNHFLDRMQEFTKLIEIERELNKQKSNAESRIDIDLGSETCFDRF